MKTIGLRSAVWDFFAAVTRAARGPLLIFLVAFGFGIAAVPASAGDCAGLDCPSPAPNTRGQATGGGQLVGELAEITVLSGTAPGARTNFSFDISFSESDPAPTGYLTYHDKGSQKKVKSVTIKSFSVVGTRATFSGEATINGSSSGDFLVEVEDLGGPGHSDSADPDTFRIVLDDGYVAFGVLIHGNIQVREGTPPPQSKPFMVGAGKRTLNPTLESAPPDGQVFLGGFGLGAGRRSTGVLGSGAWVRAFVVDNGAEVIALVESDNQGTFAAYELTRAQAGTVDIAKAVEALQPRLRADHIVIAADHSHAGQDLIGVWGGVPNEYLEFVKAQTVAAILEAYDSREPADLWVGSVGGILAGDATSILNSQFDDSSCTPTPTPEDWGHTALPCTEPGDFPDWDLVDDAVRVLHAKRPDGTTVATFVNFAAHATVMGSGNHLISADWPGPTAEKIEAALGGTAVVMPAANGRTQPDRGGGTDPQKLDAYSTTISSLALRAVAAADQVVGNEVAAKKRLIFEAADNAGLLALAYAGQAGCFVEPIPDICVPIMRSKTPPWSEGNLLGTIVSAVRVGNVLFTGTPGEPYPQIAFGVQQAVDAGPPGAGDITHHFLFSLSDDQLGYLIAPSEGVPFAGEKTGNDNFLFNVAPTIGDHVMCTAIDLALDIGLPAGTAQAPRCSAWLAEPDINPATLAPN